VIPSTEGLERAFRSPIFFGTQFDMAASLAGWSNGREQRVKVVRHRPQKLEFASLCESQSERPLSGARRTFLLRTPFAVVALLGPTPFASRKSAPARRPHNREANLVQSLGRRSFQCWRRVALVPKLFGDLQWLNLHFMPPGHFVTRLMQLLVMITAERHRELIANLETQGAGLCET